MDKYEYKVCLEDIKSLLSQKQFAQAAEIADRVDWSRVKNISTLCMVSDLYKINKRIKDSRNVLMNAYEREPENPKIIYALCELELQLPEGYVRALQLYTAFVRVAPQDPNRFILQYKLYQAQKVSLDERIQVMEDYAREIYKDKWALELALLYEQKGSYPQCSQVCDVVISRGKPRFVRQALELKQKYYPLPAEQQALLDQLNLQMASQQAVLPTAEEVRRQSEVSRMTEQNEAMSGVQAVSQSQMSESLEAGKGEIRVKPMDNSMASTVNLQANVAEGLRSLMNSERKEEAAPLRPMARSATYEELASQVASNNGSSGSWDDIRSANDRRHREENRRRLMENTGVLFDRFDEEMKHGVLEEVERRADAAARSARVAEAIPSGGELSDGMTDNERLSARLARPDYRGEEGEYRDNLLRDDEGGTRIWRGREIDEMMRDRDERDFNRGGNRYPEDDRYDRVSRDDRHDDEYARDDRRDDRYADESRDDRSDRYAEESRDERYAGAAQDNGRNGVREDRYFADRGRSVREDLRPDDYYPEYPEDTEESSDDRQMRVPSPVHASEEPEVSAAAEPEKYPEEEIEPAASVADVVAAATSVPAAAGDGGQEDLPEENEAKPMTETQEIAELIRRETEEDERAEQAKKAEAEAARAAQERAERERAAREAAERARAERERAAREAAERARAEREQAAREAAERARADREAEAGERADRAVSETVSAAGAVGEAAAAVSRPVSGRPSAARPVQGRPIVPESGRNVRDNAAAADRRQPERQDAPVREKNEVSGERSSKKSDADRIRSMSPEQRKMFAPFLHERNTRAQVLDAMENMSLAPYTGNVIITGDDAENRLSLAKILMKDFRSSERNFSGKAAMTNAKVLNKRDVRDYLGRLDNGGIIIDLASGLNAETADALHRALENDEHGILVIMVDRRNDMDSLLAGSPDLASNFNVRVDIRALSNEELVAIAKHYAERQDCTMDDMAELALARRIEAMQTSEHSVTVDEVRRIVDEAVAYASKKTPGHMMDVMFRKRYDDDDRIILREKDFNHYDTE